MQEGESLCVIATKTELHKWPSGWRLIPLPRVCKCGAQAAGLLSWTDKLRLLHDFAGCLDCARKKKAEIEAAGFTVRAYKYSQKDNYEQENKV